MLNIRLPNTDLDDKLISPKSVCELYLMLKLHFNGKYDVVKYNWRYFMSEDAYNSRKDKRDFERLANKYKLRELVYLFVSNLVADESNWIRGMTDSEAINFYRTYVGRIETYSNEFVRNMRLVMKVCEMKSLTLPELFKYNSERETSPLLQMFYNSGVTYELMIALDSIFNIIDYYDKVSDSLEWEGYSNILKAYRKVLKVDIVKVMGELNRLYYEKYDIVLFDRPKAKKVIENYKLREKHSKI